jgi:hypothetical protein
MIYLLILLVIGLIFFIFLSSLLSIELDRYLRANAKLASENYHKDVELGKLRHKLILIKDALE